MYLPRLHVEPTGLYFSSAELSAGPRTQAYPVFGCFIPTSLRYRMGLYLSLARVLANNLSSTPSLPILQNKIWQSYSRATCCGS